MRDEHIDPPPEPAWTCHINDALAALEDIEVSVRKIPANAFCECLYEDGRVQVIEYIERIRKLLGGGL